MNLKSFSLLRREPLSSSQPVSKNNLNLSVFVSVLTLAAAATVSQTERAAAIDLKFNTPVETNNVASPGGLGLGAGYNGTTMRFLNVASGVDAKVTQSVFGTGYSFAAHTPNYSSNAAQPNGDIAPVYQVAANQAGAGGMIYTIDLFQSGGTFSTAYVAPDLRFSVYDVDGENPTTTGSGTTQSGVRQNEAVRVFKRTGSSGFAGYQVGSATNALIPSEETTSYLFSGRSVNQLESNTAGAALFYFLNTSSVTFQFEANTTAPLVTSGVNPVFSAIDGDVSLIGNNSTNFDALGRATTAAGFSSYVAANAATAVPEPFTIIGTLIGGTAAFRMRKKLKSTKK